VVRTNERWIQEGLINRVESSASAWGRTTAYVSHRLHGKTRIDLGRLEGRVTQGAHSGESI